MAYQEVMTVLKRLFTNVLCEPSSLTSCEGKQRNLSSQIVYFKVRSKACEACFSFVLAIHSSIRTTQSLKTASSFNDLLNLNITNINSRLSDKALLHQCLKEHPEIILDAMREIVFHSGWQHRIGVRKNAKCLSEWQDLVILSPSAKKD